MSIVCNLQWEKSDDKPAIAGLVVSGLIGIWAAFGLIGVSFKIHFRLCAACLRVTIYI
jgi:hypothetical protein